MSALHDLLDGVADGALARGGATAPDPAAALARAVVVRRAAARRRAVLVVAAAVVVGVLAGAAWVAGWPRPVAPPAAPGTPRGLPDRWSTPPVWVPLVTDEPIEAASLLLVAPVHPAYDEPGGDKVVVSGAVLVSADGRAYRRVPLGPGASAVSLSPSGRRVAWLETDPGRPGLGESDLVVLDLATGRRTVVGVGGDPGPAAVSWFPGEREVAVTVVTGEGGEREGRRVDLGGRVEVQCRCGTDGVLVVDPTGAQRTAGDVADAPGATPLRVPGGAVDVPVPLAAVAAAISPDGRRTAYRVQSGAVLLVTDDAGRTARHPLPAALGSAAFLAWTAQGIVAATPPEGRSGGALWFVDPDSGAATQVAVGAGKAAAAGVARDLVTATPVRAEPPGTSRLSRAYLRDVVAHPGSHPVTAQMGAAALAAAALGVAVGLVILVLGRLATLVTGRRGRRPGPPANASGP